MRTSSRSARRRLPAATLALLLAAAITSPGGGASPASAAPPEGPTAPGAPPASAATGAVSTEVLLISGDRVTHTAYADGTSTVEVDPAERPDGTPAAFQTVESPDGHYVIPVDAFPLLADGILDQQLFNVEALVGDGLAGPDHLPVIVTGEADAGPATMSAGERTATLPSIDGAGLGLERADATALWRSLTKDGPRAAAGGDTRVWLDRKIEVGLADSVPQIGAPDLWDAGFDGSGVTVAVLDTGIDADHPDLAGRVVGTANFTPDPLADGHGHGTHVASTVAGSGAASGGERRGVAPEADLLIGKVLPDSGTGPTSAVIEGLEWAAQAGADVVNLSLGGPATDGTDPASMAVEHLTEQTGALFVIASGNEEGDASVNSPGAASAALTVGAVDKQDQLAWFSNRGPRHGDAAVKPEITAPGDAIVAARAAGTSLGTPVDDHYTSAGGTSMATPHVAGAAALLAQAQPDWTWHELKDALVSTAEPGDYRVFEGGAGRLDVAAASAAQVHGPAAANLGAIPAPYDEARTEELTYRNHGEEPVTLQLELAGESWHGQDLPDGAASLGADTLSVPAGGQASVPLSVDGDPGEPGAYAGMVTASSGDASLRTPFGYYKSVGSNELTIRVRDFRGEPQDGQALRAVKLDGALPNDPFFQMETWEWSDDDGEVQLQVADGLYDVYGSEVSYWDTHGDRISHMAETEIEIDGDTTVRLDGRNAVKVDPQLPIDTDLKSASATYNRGTEGGEFGTGHMINYDPISLYMQPVEHSVGWLEIREQWSLAGSLLNTAEVRTTGRDIPISPEYHNYYAGPGLAGAHDLELVDAGTGTDTELARAGVAGKAALIRIPVPHDDPNPYTAVWRAANDVTDAAADQGAAAVLLYTDEPGAKAIHSLRSEEIPQLAVSWHEGMRVRSQVRGARREPPRLVLDAQQDPQDLYHLRYVHEDTTLPQPRQQVDLDELVTVESRYHADEPGWTQSLAALAFTPRQDTVAGLRFNTWTPLAVSEHVLPGDHLRWFRSASQRGPDVSTQNTELASREMFLPGDQRDTEVWFQSPMRTGAADLPPETQWAEVMCTFCRHGDMFRPGVWYLDSDPRHYDRSILQEGTSYRLFSGGEEIPNSGSSFVPAFELSEQPATYRLEMEGIQPGVPTARTLAPRTETSWTFESQRPDAGAKPEGYSCPSNGDTGCAFQSLLQLDYQLDLDMLNRAEAGGAHTFEVGVAPHSQVAQPGAHPVPRFSVWYSTDEGDSWRKARVRPDRGRTSFEVTVEHPPLAETAGYVWLRAEARDRAGNEIEQTIERAYRLR